jgi:hypothetical protein
MTGDEMERAIDFLLKSQANLEARIGQVNARINPSPTANDNIHRRVQG